MQLVEAQPERIQAPPAPAAPLAPKAAKTPQCPWCIEHADGADEFGWWRCQSSAGHPDEHTPPPNARSRGEWFKRAHPEALA